ncbi:MAG TPA: LeuA family protein [Vicinamibacterales bacterium]|jgi:2-isopropylmalate synthase|nr:LeuA family protein [Vicinamibacterales bacterium]
MNKALIYDWNRNAAVAPPPLVMLDDETLRDGLQSPSVRAPSIDQKLKILRLLDEIGVDTADIGLPGAGPHVVRDVERLSREIVSCKLKLKPNCAARTVISDIQPIVEVTQRVGIPIECCCFIGSSPIRRYAEDWTVDYLQRCTEEAVSFGVNHGLQVMYVTEDTTRSDPETLRRLFITAIRAGASRLCIADTVGHATPSGARAVVAFTKQIVDEMGGGIGIDWHGHRDRDMGTINSLAALEAGATRVHGTILGIGERVGNTPMDMLLVNLVLMGWIDRDLHRLDELVRTVAEATGEPIPDNYPVFGRDAFRTATGVHAAAVVKAFRKGDPELMDTVYSGVPAQMVGRSQQIEVGPLSGKSNVVFWLEQHGFVPEEEVVDRVFRRAKSSQRVLTEQEILDEIHVAQTYASTRLDA